jgi:hypothetical protein
METTRRAVFAATAVAIVTMASPALAQVRSVSRGDIKRAEAAEARAAATEIDRRPVLFVRIWNGSYEAGNRLGLAPQYRDDRAALAIVEQLDEAYDAGWRRLVLHTPTGAPRTAVLNRTLEEWWRRSPQWRSSMRQAILSWKQDHPDAALGVYMGLFPRSGEAPRQAWLERCLWPLLDAGFELFVFDASSVQEARPTFLAAQAWLGERGAKAVMEAYPIDRSGEENEIDPEWLPTTPMVALQRYMEMQDPDGDWRLDPAASEVWLGVGRTEAFDEETLRDQVERGFVPFVYWLDAEDRRRALEIATEVERAR